MDLNKQYIQRKIQIRKAASNTPSLSDFATAQPNLQQKMSSAWASGKSSNVVFDYYLPIMISRTSEVYEYVDVKKDERIFKIERQETNPYFVEFGCFDDISRIKTNLGSDLTPKMLNFIINKIGSVKILKEYPLGHLATLIFPTDTQYNGFMGIFIADGAREQSRPGTSKILLEGTPYDGAYQISFDWRDNNNNIGGFYCTPQRILNIDSEVTQDGSYTWSTYGLNIPNSNAKIKLIESIFDAGDWNSVRNWFNRIGYNQFVAEVDPETKDNVIDSLDKLEIIWTNLVSKANYFNIDINK